jgi:transcriptional regulator with XRE-family HTH domain
MTKGQNTTTIPINGFACREIRVRSGIEIAPFAEQVGVSRAYMAKIELGHSTRVSPTVFSAILCNLHIADRRALLAQPHRDAQAGAA